MTGLLSDVDRRTQMAGQNRLELLLFRLADQQRFGINVFKVQEVIQCPPLTHLPKSDPAVCGVAHLRGKTIPVIDLSYAIGEPALEGTEGRFVVITEYNRSTQGFLVDAVEEIIDKNWDEIKPPPVGIGHENYLTAVTKVGEQLVEIIDVERILDQINHAPTEIDEALRASAAQVDEVPKRILIADDSAVARKQMLRALEPLELEILQAKDGKEALERLQQLADEAPGPLSQSLLLVISDVEMPNMDGYTLTTQMRQDPRMADLYVILHTSLSGVFNSALVEKVGANLFVPKFDANELAQSVATQMAARQG